MGEPSFCLTFKINDGLSIFRREAKYMGMAINTPFACISNNNILHFYYMSICALSWPTKVYSKHQNLSSRLQKVC